MANTLTIRQKKEWAKLLYTKENLTQKEIAERVGTSIVSVNNWKKKDNWDALKQSMLVTRENQLRMLYMQLDELTTHINNKEMGSRFADSKQADTIMKLTASIRTLETDASIADIVEVAKRLINWLKAINPVQAREVAQLFDDFIKDALSRR